MWGAAVPDRHLFLYCVDTTDIEDLHSHIYDMAVTIRSIQCVSNENAKYKSFRLTVPVSHYKQLFNSAIWVTGDMYY